MTADIFSMLRQHSAAAVAVIVLVALFRLFIVQTTLPNEGQAYLKRWVAGEFSAAAIAAKPSSPTEEELAAWRTTLVQPEDVSFASLKVKGMTGKHYLIRADIRIKGAPPPQGPSVIYYKLDYFLLGGWQMKYRTTAFSYYTCLW